MMNPVDGTPAVRFNLNALTTDNPATSGIRARGDGKIDVWIHKQANGSPFPVYINLLNGLTANHGGNPTGCVQIHDIRVEPTNGNTVPSGVGSSGSGNGNGGGGNPPVVPPITNTGWSATNATLEPNGSHLRFCEEPVNGYHYASQMFSPPAGEHFVVATVVSEGRNFMINPVDGTPAVRFNLNALTTDEPAISGIRARGDGKIDVWIRKQATGTPFPIYINLLNWLTTSYFGNPTGCVQVHDFRLEPTAGQTAPSTN